MLVYIEILVYIVVLLGLIPIAGYFLSYVDIFWTRIETGDIKFVMRGDSLHKIIHHVEGKQLVDGKFVDGEEKRSFFNRRFGIFWIGFPPFSGIHTFPIHKEHQDNLGGKVKEWVKKDETETIVKSLRYAFPRPYILESVELSDRFTVNLLILAKFEVVTPSIPVFIFKGKFFEMAGSILRSAIIDVMKEYDIKELIKANKSEVNGILAQSGMKEPDGPLNRELVTQVGIRLVAISITQYDAEDLLKTAMQKEVIARQEGDALIVAAQKYAAKLEIETTADADRITRLGEAQGKRVRETVTAFVLPGANPNAVVSGASEVLATQEMANNKVTTWVRGGAQTVLPLKEDK